MLLLHGDIIIEINRSYPVYPVCQVLPLAKPSMRNSHCAN